MQYYSCVGAQKKNFKILQNLICKLFDKALKGVRACVALAMGMQISYAIKNVFVTVIFYSVNNKYLINRKYKIYGHFTIFILSNIDAVPSSLTS